MGLIAWTLLAICPLVVSHRILGTVILRWTPPYPAEVDEKKFLLKGKWFNQYKDYDLECYHTQTKSDDGSDIQLAYILYKRETVGRWWVKTCEAAALLQSIIVTSYRRGHWIKIYNTKGGCATWCFEPEGGLCKGWTVTTSCSVIHRPGALRTGDHGWHRYKICPLVVSHSTVGTVIQRWAEPYSVELDKTKFLLKGRWYNQYKDYDLECYNTQTKSNDGSDIRLAYILYKKQAVSGWWVNTCDPAALLRSIIVTSYKFGHWIKTYDVKGKCVIWCFELKGGLCQTEINHGLCRFIPGRPAFLRTGDHGWHRYKAVVIQPDPQ